jgi:uncharacterized membrane protein YGL010W
MRLLVGALDERQEHGSEDPPLQKQAGGGFMLGGRSWDSWIAEYAEGHQHPVNRITHTFGIPIIILSGPVALAGIFWHPLLWVALGLFLFGWLLQFIGHAFEGKPPEFLKDWRFLLVGSRWWAAKMRGKA